MSGKLTKVSSNLRKIVSNKIFQCILKQDTHNLMKFDESQAKGLKNHLIREVENQLIEFLEPFENSHEFSDVGNLSSINSFNRFNAALSKGIDRFTTSKYEGLSKGKKYVAYATICSSDSREYEQWTEKSIYGFNVLVGNTFECEEGSYSLSEHTITRYFQRRNFTDSFNPNKDIFLLIEDLKYVPYYSAYWTRMAFFHLRKLGVKKIDIEIPGVSGLFLCEMNIDEIFGKVEIRTYISDEMLSDHQKQKKEFLVNALDGLEGSALPFFGILEFIQIDNIELEAKVLSNRLSKNLEILFDRSFADDDTPLGHDWTIDRIFDFIKSDLINEETNNFKMPIYPIKREQIYKKLKIKSFLD